MARNAEAAKPAGSAAAAVAEQDAGLAAGSTRAAAEAGRAAVAAVAAAAPEQADPTGPTDSARVVTDSTVTASTTGPEQPRRTAGPAVPTGGGLSVAAVTAGPTGAVEQTR